MQEKSKTIPNSVRREQTRTALLDAARRLFISKGYAETGTPEIVRAAKVTRGALYHHFEDKRALFHAVVAAENAALAQEIESRAQKDLAPLDALKEGTRAYLDQMSEPGRVRLLLVESVAVLGGEETQALDRAAGLQTLVDGLSAAMEAGAIQTLPLMPLVLSFNAMMEGAARAVSEGHPRKDVEEVLFTMIDGLAP